MPSPFFFVSRLLSEKETLLYAPMSDVGALFFDKDAVYINIPESKVKFSKPEDFSSGNIIAEAKPPNKRWASEISESEDESGSEEGEEGEDEEKRGADVPEGVRMVKSLQSMEQGCVCVLLLTWASFSPPFASHVCFSCYFRVARLVHTASTSNLVMSNCGCLATLAL